MAAKFVLKKGSTGKSRFNLVATNRCRVTRGRFLDRRLTGRHAPIA
jgi:hypothetical protein